MNRVPALAVATTLIGTALVATAAVPTKAASGDEIIPGVVRIESTYDNIGVLWSVDGDLDLDSSMRLEYRRVGSSGWRSAARAVRAYPTISVNGSRLGLDTWGASAMFLDSGGTYDLRLTLSDPDGGGTTRVVSATTRQLAVPDPSGRVLSVVPGSGGGTGSATDPFKGLQSAAAAARGGDTFRVAGGTYAPFQIMESGSDGRPISFIADGVAIIDGDGTDRGVVTIGNYDRNTGNIILEGFVIQGGRWGVDAQNTHDIVIRRNVIRDVDFGVYNRRANASEARQTVCDNSITGRTAWPQSGIPGERGIDLRGTGNVVCYNTVRYFADCISVQPSTGPSNGNDIYGNDAAFCVDDGIEIDYNQANVRVWGNRVTNARTGVSVQPIAGGPAYIVRNEFFNLESAPIKMHNETSGFIVAHNTGVKVGDGHGDNGAMWRNTIFRNNVFIGTRYAFEFVTVRDEGFRDFDYNAWGTSRAVGPGGPWFKWENVRYDRISDLPPGVEDHGVEMVATDFVHAELPSAWNVAAVPGSADLRLVDGAAAIDAGEVLPNLNDGFVIDGAPDMGAFERGTPLPSYGPRIDVPGSRFVDVGRRSLFFGEIEWLAARGITKGCNPPVNDRFCPDGLVTRGQMAAFLVRALDLVAGSGGRFFDDDGSVFEGDIEALAGAGITKGCNPPVNDRFCPDGLVTREQMAAFLERALSG